LVVDAIVPSGLQAATAEDHLIVERERIEIGFRFVESDQPVAPSST